MVERGRPNKRLNEIGLRIQSISDYALAIPLRAPGMGKEMIEYHEGLSHEYSDLVAEEQALRKTGNR